MRLMRTYQKKNIMKTKSLYVFIITSTIYFSSCNNNQMQHEAQAFEIKGDTVYVNAESTLARKIILSDTEAIPYSKEVVTAGTVQPIPTQFAYIAPPFSGRIINSYIKLGQKVNAKTPLFEISSPEFTSAQKEFYQAQSSKELAKKDLNRKEDLIKNGVSSQKELEEAINTLHIAEKEYENAYTALKIYNVNPEKMLLGQPLVVLSPISGNVIANNIVTGQYINSDSEHVATIADLTQVWIVAQVKEKDIRFIHQGDDMDIYISALPGQTLTGKVFHIEEAVDEETRSIKVLSVCNNKDGLLKIGMYTTVHFIDKPVDLIQIPEKALLQGEKESYVYVQIAANTFIRTPVETETTIDGKAIISKGLKIGDKIISEGGYYLK